MCIDGDLRQYCSAVQKSKRVPKVDLMAPVSEIMIAFMLMKAVSELPKNKLS